jgi:pyruvyltransferase
LVVGSILGRVQKTSVVWGVGSFGTEGGVKVIKDKKYLAVRGPLTRSKIEMFGGKCPDNYGDPALLMPEYYNKEVEVKYDLGIVLRWSENNRKQINIEGVKIIELLTDDVEGVIDQMRSCRRIISTSLHGLIIADAYKIPNSWLIAETGRGKEFKFWDYLISVGKVRSPKVFNINAAGLTITDLLREFDFDEREPCIDLNKLKAQCPFISMTEEIAQAEKQALDAADELRNGELVFAKYVKKIKNKIIKLLK